MGVAFLILAGCTNAPPNVSDRPRIGANMVLRDVSFYSNALARQMPYRAVFPSSIPSDRKLAVVYLLHGSGGSFRDWSNYSDVSRLGNPGLIMIMPEGDYSYYLNAVDPPGNRYEDYIVRDLLSDVEARFPVAKGRADRAIVGVSMGGFGAVKIALSHPTLFGFAGALSPAIDVARRRFSIRRIEQYRALSAIFGPPGSTTRRANDPFVIAQSVDAPAVPYLFLTCGASEGLLAPNREFAAVLEQRRIKYEFHVVPGDHDWNQWNRELPSVFAALENNK